MTISDILCVMGEAGIRFDRTVLPKVFNYVSNMIEDNRCITITDDLGNKVGVIFYSVCEEYDAFYKKGKWDYLPHDKDGHIVYIECAASSIWSKELRKLFEDGLLQKYPNLQVGVWHRWAKWGDRRVVTKRRLSNVPNTHSHK